MFRNSTQQYGVVTLFLHWLAALAIPVLFALGLWMTELDYYHQWYKKAPDLHKSIGLSLFFLMLIRLVWQLINPKPQTQPAPPALMMKIARGMHHLLYLLTFCVMCSGYLISTADGRGIAFFGGFEIPAVISGINQQEDIAGNIHLILAIALIVMASLHALAALKHHFIDKDNTLKKMLGKS